MPQASSDNDYCKLLMHMVKSWLPWLWHWTFTRTIMVLFLLRYCSAIQHADI